MAYYGTTLYPVPPPGGSYVPSPTISMSTYPVYYTMHQPAPAITTHTYVMSPRQEKVVYSVVSPRSNPVELLVEPPQTERQVIVQDLGLSPRYVVEKRKRNPVIQHHGHKTVIKDGKDQITIRDRNKEIVIKEKIPYVYDCYRHHGHGYGNWCGGCW
ncbi:uncharacterized protein [Littorina saxatilis]|uniref:uncharacterized protein isoform X2 n=1 Tax=Littorina saxatilis TaxID=31220 RepID=UPI0038B45AD1